MNEQTIEQIANIIGTIMAIALIVLLVLLVIYALIYTIKTENMQQDYIKHLNEHDKAVIIDYKNCHWTIKKKKNKQPKDEKI